MTRAAFQLEPRAPETKSPQTAQPYPERRRTDRRAARERAAGRVRVPVNAATKTKDPLLRPAPKGRAAAQSGGLLVAAIALHIAVPLALGILDPQPATLRTPTLEPEVVVMRVSEPPPRQAVEPASPAPAQEIEAPTPQPTPAPPKAEKKRRVKPKQELSADPVDVPAKPTQTPPRRRVVGLSFESTATGGSGPSFAVGNTRMGATGRLAEEAKKIEKLGGEPRVQTKNADSPNQVASLIPRRGVELSKPVRLSSPELEYPPVLKAQGVEANVAVLIRIAESGDVKSVKVVRSSGYKEFDEAARRSAKNERFTPAKRNGEPIEYTIKYTYKFRIKNA